MRYYGLYLNPIDGPNNNKAHFCLGGGCDCGIYALYMSNCFGGANNNMRILVNNQYLGDFNASYDSLAWNGFPQNGAPEKCGHAEEAASIPGNYSDAPNRCGGDYGRLFFLNSSQLPFDGLPPNSQSRWNNATLSNIIITWHNIGLIFGATEIGNPANFQIANILTMRFYTKDFHNGIYACCRVLPDGSTGARLFNKPKTDCPCRPDQNGNCTVTQCDNIGSILENTSGGCLGIIRYKKRNNRLVDPKFLPLRNFSSFGNNFTNKFPATINNRTSNAFTFLWWDEGNLPVSYDPVPSWATPIQYYW